MEEHIHLFNTISEFESVYNSSAYTEPFIGYILETQSAKYNKPPHDYSKDYLTFNIISGGTIVWKANNTAYTTTISYSKDNGTTWTDITSNTGSSAPSISVNTGDKVMFKGNNATYSYNTSRYNSFSGSTAKFNAEGNIMSLIDSTNFATATTLTSADTFFRLFAYCTGLTSAENLVLPATTLATYCYLDMFDDCTSLITAPELPATTLATGCYEGMFYGCTSLATAPELPATTLASDCYQNMFENCTSLTTAPSLPATTLTENCYCAMFLECTSLTTAPSLPATTLANGCYDGMFAGCTSLTTAPELPATTLTRSCYYEMFRFCANLNYIKCLATNISAPSCTTNWVDGVASSGTFVKYINMSGWTTGNNGIPTGWTVKKTNLVSVAADDIKVGDELVVSVICPGDYVGDCHLTVNNAKYTASVVGGVAMFEIPGLPAGTYTAYAELPETNIYEAASGTATFNVSKIEPVIIIDAFEEVAYESFVISVNMPEDYEGDCHLTVNNIEYVSPSISGTALFEIPGLPAGTYTVYAEVPETATYESASATETFTVKPA